MKNQNSSIDYTPQGIIAELNRFVIGQEEAKKAVAVALRNKWRWMNLQDPIKAEIVPKNILLIGPTGCGKTEIARRLAKCVQAPFIKVEATKFTEIGYVGRDVEHIIRDLVEVAVRIEKDKEREKHKQSAEEYAEERIIAALAGKNSQAQTQEIFREKLHNGELEDTEIEIVLPETTSNDMHTITDSMGMPGAAIGMFNLEELFGKITKRTKTRKLKISEARTALINEEIDKLTDKDTVTAQALKNAQENGVVFIDEIDKICSPTNGIRNSASGEISREGVQRDLLPLIEGTSVSTKYGSVQTDNILFITSGAFYSTKPSDLLPELQGRLPIRITLKPLTENQFFAILTETENSIIKQYQALLSVEGVTLEFENDALREIVSTAVQTNRLVEDIGARRLHNLVEKVLENINFEACDGACGTKIIISQAYVKMMLKETTEGTDLAKFII